MHAAYNANNKHRGWGKMLQAPIHCYHFLTTIMTYGAILKFLLSQQSSCGHVVTHLFFSFSFLCSHHRRFCRTSDYSICCQCWFFCPSSTRALLQEQKSRYSLDIFDNLLAFYLHISQVFHLTFKATHTHEARELEWRPKQQKPLARRPVAVYVPQIFSTW